MTDAHATPTREQLRSYLRFNGWTELPPGPVGSLWVNHGMRIGVPSNDDHDLIRAAIERLAIAEQKKTKEVANSVRFFFYDATYLRAVNDYRIVDAIPLSTASKIISSARTMLRATATTARWERAQIGTNFSKVGDEVIKEALMGHTERGSYVIPVLVPLPEPPIQDVHQPTLDHDAPEFHRAPPEPFQRRVTRTFAQSMQAVHEIVVEPAVEPRTDQIHELVYRGVSREFCVALAGILSDTAVAEFQAMVDWTPTVAPPTTMPRRVSISANAVDLVQGVADKLRQQRVDPKQVFSGTIVQLRHENQDDPYGEIAISTVRRGRPSEIHVRLPLDQYSQAWEWHYAGRAVLIEGVIRRTPGKPLRVDSPTRCHPLDEMFLSEGT